MTTTVLAKTRTTLPAWFTPTAIAVGLLLGLLPFVVLADEPNYVLGGFVSVVAILAVTGIVSAVVEGGRKSANRIASTTITAAFILAVLPLGSLLYTVFASGWERLSAAGFFTHTTFGSSNPDVVTGAGHAIQGTLMITGVTALISIPLGVLTAVYLVEYGRGKFAKTITFLVDVMTGIPSIVAGLFAAAVVPILNEIFTGQPQFKTGFMGSLALVVLMTPIVIRNTEEMLRLVPNELREASYALGVTKAGTIIKVVLRTAYFGFRDHLWDRHRHRPRYRRVGSAAYYRRHNRRLQPEYVRGADADDSGVRLRPVRKRQCGFRMGRSIPPYPHRARP